MARGGLNFGTFLGAAIPTHPLGTIAQSGGITESIICGIYHVRFKDRLKPVVIIKPKQHRHSLWFHEPAQQPSKTGSRISVLTASKVSCYVWHLWILCSLLFWRDLSGMRGILSPKNSSRISSCTLIDGQLADLLFSHRNQ